MAKNILGFVHTVNLVILMLSGCADKVKCYCCGVGLHKWKQGSNPWEQHALHMPACPLVQAKGHNFAQLAAEVPVSSHFVQA